MTGGVPTQHEDYCNMESIVRIYQCIGPTINSVIQGGKSERCKGVRWQEVFIRACTAHALAVKTSSDTFQSHQPDLVWEEGICLLNEGHLWYHVRERNEHC